MSTMAYLGVFVIFVPLLFTYIQSEIIESTSESANQTICPANESIQLRQTNSDDCVQYYSARFDPPIEACFCDEGLCRIGGKCIDLDSGDNRPSKNTCDLTEDFFESNSCIEKCETTNDCPKELEPGCYCLPGLCRREGRCTPTLNAVAYK